MSHAGAANNVEGVLFSRSVGSPSECCIPFSQTQAQPPPHSLGGGVYSELILNKDEHFLQHGVCSSLLFVGMLWFGFFRVVVGWSKWKEHRRWVSESCETLLNKSVLGYGNEMDQESCSALKVVSNVCFSRYVLHTSPAYRYAQCLLRYVGKTRDHPIRKSCR